MMRTVKKGKARFLPFFPFLNVTKKITKYITFTESCKYDLKGDDQLDWNKLFGVGFFPDHQKNSFRFVWRYNVLFGEIELGVYSYINGELESHATSLIPIGQKTKMTIRYKDGFVFYEVGERLISYTTVRADRWPLIGYKLGPYFGGNKKAPQTIKINMSW